MSEPQAAKRACCDLQMQLSGSSIQTKGCLLQTEMHRHWQRLVSNMVRPLGTLASIYCDDFRHLFNYINQRVWLHAAMAGDDVVSSITRGNSAASDAC